MFETKSANNPEEAELSAAKKSFSVIGLALGTALVLSVGFQILLSYFTQEAGLSSTTLSLIASVFMYCVAFPVGMLLLSIGPKAKPVLGQRHGFAVYAALLSLTVELTLTGDLISSFFAGTTESFSWEFANAAEALIFAAVYTIAAPAMEELFFRKFLVGKLSTWGFPAAIIISSLFYAFFRSDILTAALAVFVGAIYAYSYLTTGKVKYPILIHIFINLFFVVIPVLSENYLATTEEIEEFAEAFNTWGNAGMTDSSAIAGVISENSGVVAATLLNTLLGYLQLGLAVAGVVVLLFFKHKIDMKPGEKKLKANLIGDTVFMAPGIMFFLLVAIAIAVFNIYIG